jgi:hypothetical protein
MKMEQIEGSCTVYFDDPFWVGVFERTYNNTYQVARVVFGAEPSNQEILDFLTFHYDRVVFSIPSKTEVTLIPYRVKAKRSIRNARKEVRKPIGNASHLALQKQWELVAKERKETRKNNREAREEKKFLLHQEKRKQAKKGK